MRILGQQAQGVPLVPDDRASVSVLVAAYLPGAEIYYRHKDSTPTTEIAAIRCAVKPLLALYGPTAANDFTPTDLKALRVALMTGSWMSEDLQKKMRDHGREPGRCRKVINKDVDRIRRIWRAGVEKGIVRPEVYQMLMAVEHLKMGRSEARETDDVGPAPAAAVGTRYPFCIQGDARPGEVCRLTPGDIDRTGEALRKIVGEKIELGKAWAYIPDRHKTAHHGHKRVIPLGPMAQELLAPYLLGRADDAFLFSPAESRAAFDEARRAGRTTPRWPSHEKKRKTSPKKKPGAFYSPSAYAAAIATACKKADVERWHPHQLRHNACDNLVAEFGWEVARIVLGHRTLNSTRIYAPDNLAKGFAAIEKVG